MPRNSNAPQGQQYNSDVLDWYESFLNRIQDKNIGENDVRLDIDLNNPATLSRIKYTDTEYVQVPQYNPRMQVIGHFFQKANTEKFAFIEKSFDQNGQENGYVVPEPPEVNVNKTDIYEHYHYGWSESAQAHADQRFELHRKYKNALPNENLEQTIEDVKQQKKAFNYAQTVEKSEYANFIKSVYDSFKDQLDWRFKNQKLFDSEDLAADYAQIENLYNKAKEGKLFIVPIGEDPLAGKVQLTVGADGSCQAISPAASNSAYTPEKMAFFIKQYKDAVAGGPEAVQQLNIDPQVKNILSTRLVDFEEHNGPIEELKETGINPPPEVPQPSIKSKFLHFISFGLYKPKDYRDRETYEEELKDYNRKGPIYQARVKEQSDKNMKILKQCAKLMCANAEGLGMTIPQNCKDPASVLSNSSLLAESNDIVKVQNDEIDISTEMTIFEKSICQEIVKNPQSINPETKTIDINKSLEYWKKNGAPRTEEDEQKMKNNDLKLEQEEIAWEQKVIEAQEAKKKIAQIKNDPEKLKQVIEFINQGEQQGKNLDKMKELYNIKNDNSNIIQVEKKNDELVLGDKTNNLEPII